MSVSEELLNKYFKGLCTPEEKLRVARYLNQTEDLPENLLSKDEWDDTHDAELTAVKTEEMFRAVKKQTIAKVDYFKWGKILTAAAVLIAVVTLGLLSLNRKTSNFNLVQNKQSQVQKMAVVSWKSVVNYTEQDQMLTLPDQSVVKIYPGGELRYTVPFINEKRELYLKGKGFFQVTKDKKHPFVVYANGISTTALGTSFTITALEKGRFIKVQLHTGKVWIKNIDSVHRIVAFSKVLMPGKELVYNTLMNQIKVRDTKILDAERSLKELNFTQAPLAMVFARLEKQYKVKIKYDPADLDEMSFTGSLKLAQPIDTILEEIAELNKLNKTKTNEGYLISK